MAAFPHQRIGSWVAVDGAGGSINGPLLPSGSCNFRDLNTGGQAPTCGCARFWLNTGHWDGNNTSHERAWCFCGHHACFHTAFSQQRQPGEKTSFRAARSSERGGVIGESETDRFVQERAGSQPIATAGLGILPGPPSHQSQSQSINTRVWAALNAFAREQQDDGSSKLPSTAAPSSIGDTSHTRPETGQQFRYSLMGPPGTVPSNLQEGAGAEEYSATEAATPSIAGTPDLGGVQAQSSPSNLRPAFPETYVARDPVPATQPAGPVQEASAQQSPQQWLQGVVSPNNLSTQHVQGLLQSYGRRIDILESLSFSHVPVEEIQDKLELFDGRLLDLEAWKTDREELQHDSPEPEKATNSKGRRLLPTECGSFGSNGSFDSSAALHTEAAVLATLAANAETRPRIEALDSRISDLENAALPSYHRPWEVQVVLLPWGADLRGIWFSSIPTTQQSTRSSQQALEEWAGAQSVPRLSFTSSTTGAWTTESIQAWADDAQEWLSPKACGPTGTIFQRLASRGLVRDVTLTASDSRHVLSTISNAFGTTLNEYETLNVPGGSNFHALRENFIPLRKVRKSSRLRFLAPAEMVTSATWTAAFLESSVFMKVSDGQRRLYLTTPEAYLQRSPKAWSWYKLRQLPLHDASRSEQAAQRSNAAIEACWSYNERLDSQSSNDASFTSHESHWSPHSERSIHENIETQPLLASPRGEPHPGIRLSHQRTVSLPGSSSTNNLPQPAASKRRVASFETAGTPAIQTNHEAVLVTGKRRRISTSPEAERKGVGLTPRWSREPPSPFTSEYAGEARSQGAGGGRMRGMTPFAYATPHSNSNYASRVEFLGGDGDTEADTDRVAPQSERGEDEWEGVDEGTDAHYDSGSAVDEAEIEEGNPIDELRYEV